MFVLSLGIAIGGGADGAKEYSVQVTASVQAAPARITLQWLQDSVAAPDRYTVYRRAAQAPNWERKSLLPGTATRYIDDDVVAGRAYEYEIVKTRAAYSGYGYIDAGIRLPLTEDRGTLLLVVDKTHAAELARELARLQQDLTGDGWSVERIDVNRGDSVQRVKGLIRSAYLADPDRVKSVFLFGHVPVPYSGDIVPDGHCPDHRGAWPCDGYYGDMDGTWTDCTVDDTSASDPRNRNVPGDGKFDQSIFPAPLKLMVGRVDLADMPGRRRLGGEATFPNETELLRNYLNKDHNFRNKLISAPERALVGDYFGARDGEAFAASGWRNFAPFFGGSNITVLPNYGTWISTLSTNAYLWAYGCGAGSYTSIEGIGRYGRYDDGLSTDLVRADVKAVFTMLYGSWLGDWDSEDNLQRAVLATPDYGLTCAWSGRPHWFFQHMALGQPIGFSTLVTQNDGFTGLYQNEQNNCAGWVHIALMGDPTLRMHIVAPPSRVSAIAHGWHTFVSWKPSNDAIEGYAVYRAKSANGPFLRRNASLVTGTTYVDAGAAPADGCYMVRAVKLERSASGTYFNPSEGAFSTSGDGSLDLAHSADGGTHAPSAGRLNSPAGSPRRTGLDEAAGGRGAFRAARSGRTLSATGSATGTGATDTVWFDDALPAGASATADGGDAWNWVSSNPAPFSGSLAHQSNIAQGEHQQVFNWAYQGSFGVSTGDVLITYVYLDPANPPSEVMLQWFDSSWEHRAYWGADTLSFGTDNTSSRHSMGPLPAAGQWVRLEVPANQVGLEGSTLLGMCFTEYNGRATWDYTGKSTAVSGTNSAGGATGTVTNSANLSNPVSWVDDALPSGAIPGSSGGDSWTWISSNPAPESGSLAHQSIIGAGEHQHNFDWAYGGSLVVNTGDVLYTYVYMDPANLPSELMLEWFDSSWEHRAYWGANDIVRGTDGTISRHYMGPLPPAGQWVCLQVPASQVGLEGSTLLGMTFALYDGRATWDNAGKASASSGAPSGTGTGSSTTTNSPPSVVGTNSPPVVSTNLPPTTTNTPPAASLPFGTNALPGLIAPDDVALQIPSVGSTGLHVLTPTLLELKLINTKQADPAQVTQWNLVNNYQFNAPPLNAFAVTANGQPVGVQAVGFKRRPLYAPLVGYDLRIENSIYLQLSSPISDSQTIVVKNPDGSLWPASTIYSATVDPLRFSPAIHVNEEGYLPNYPKTAMVGYYIGSLGEMNVIASSGYKLVDASTGATVYQGTLVQRPDSGWVYTPTPYQQVYEADFSAFTTPGQYRLVVPGLGGSLPFFINDSVAMDFVRAYELGLYHQRCGTSNALPYTRFTHDACHTAPASVPMPASSFAFTWTTISNYSQQLNPDNPVQTAPALTGPSAQLFPFVRQGTLDVSGGHHDAGDYSKYTINSASFIHYLMFAVDSFPGVAALDNLGVPESGDGISDVMQEAKWEADFLAKMQDSDGGFYFLVYPQNREYENNVTPDHGDPQVVWPKTTSVTAASVAALAQCASSPLFKSTYPATAALYLQKAQLGWQFLTNAVAKYGLTGAYQKITSYGDTFADQDELAWAAASMYAATGNPGIQQTLFSWFPDPTASSTFRWGWWRLFGSYGNAVRSYAFAAQSGRLKASQLDSNYLAKCQQVVGDAGDDMLTWSQQSAYGTSFPMATKHVQGGGWYFSSDQAFDMTVAYQLNPKPEYLAAILANMNYEGGCNPLNLSFITGLGWKRQQDIVSQYAANDRRVLPPSGIPVGNVQSSFQYLGNYQNELEELCFPQDATSGQLYPYYDRWGDSWNVQDEFVILNSARSLGSLAFLAAQTSLKTQAWKSVLGQITVPATTAAVGVPLTVTLQAPGLDLSGTRITWEARDQLPVFGQTFTFAPKNNGDQWVEAEAQFPDGRRVFAEADFNADSPNLVWFDDSLPAGAQTSALGGDTWDWVSNNPTPFSGSLAHQSGPASGLHQHDFNWATATMTVSTGDVLYAYAYLDPVNPPTEIMLQWFDTSWEHRAYWGANSITWGTNASNGRRYMGPLPPTGQWVQLKVPASQVGLEGSIVQGMGFSAYNGIVTWDVAGVLNPSLNLSPAAAVSVSAANGSRVGPVPAAFTFSRTGATSTPLTVTYSLAGSATNGVDYALPSNTNATSVTIPAGAGSAVLALMPAATTNIAIPATVVLTLSTNSVYSLGSPASATMVISGNMVKVSSIQATSSGAILSWPSTNGAAYRVAYKNKLSDPAWTYAGATLNATTARTSWTDTAGQSQRFFVVIQTR